MKNHRLVSVCLPWVLCLAASCLPASAVQAALNDSCPPGGNSGETFRAEQLIVPGSLIALGTWGVYNGWLKQLRSDVRQDMARLSGGRRTGIDNYVQYAPVAAAVGLSLAGQQGRYDRRETLALTATAFATMGIMTQGVKHTVREPRPDSGTRNSFPSGHTATAFMGAELMRTTYGTAAGIGAYSIAAGIAFLRLYNDRHWLNDVVAGAGMGILSVRIACWLLPLERRLLRWTGDTEAVLAPAVHTHGASLSLSLSF